MSRRFGAAAAIPQLEQYLGLPSGSVQAALSKALASQGLTTTASPLTTAQMQAIVTSSQSGTWPSKAAQADDAAWQILNATLGASNLSQTAAFPYAQAIAKAAANSYAQQTADQTAANASAAQKQGLADTTVVGYDRQGDPINAEGMNVPSAGSCGGVVSGYSSTGVAIDCNGIPVAGAPAGVPATQQQIIPQVASISAPTDYSWLMWVGGGIAVLGAGWLLLRKKATP